MKLPLYVVIDLRIGQVAGGENIRFAQWLINKHREDRLDIEIDHDAEWKEFRRFRHEPQRRTLASFA